MCPQEWNDYTRRHLGLQLASLHSTTAPEKKNWHTGNGRLNMALELVGDKRLNWGDSLKALSGVGLRPSLIQSHYRQVELQQNWEYALSCDRNLVPLFIWIALYFHFLRNQPSNWWYTGSSGVWRGHVLLCVDFRVNLEDWVTNYHGKSVLRPNLETI